MYHFYLEGQKLPVSKSSQPTFDSKRTKWLKGEILLNSTPQEVFVENHRRKTLYFFFENIWYKLKMDMSSYKHINYFIDPFSTILTNIYTKYVNYPKN